MNILDPQGPIAAANKMILIDSIAIMLAIVVPTIIAIFAFAWYFRQSDTRAFHWPDWEYSGRLELVVWSIPALTIILLGGVAWIGSHQLDPARPVPGTGETITIDVVSLDWKWLFIYPDQRIASVNTLTVPVGAPLHFRLTSASVMNVFFIPQLGSMIYTMNGMATNLNLNANEAGSFMGLSAMFSGNGFSDMHFTTEAVPKADFDTWTKQASNGGGPTLSSQAYKDLSVQSMNVAPYTYSAVEPGLFDRIVTQELPPGPGPSSGGGF